jgi:hypothetical protein
LHLRHIPPDPKADADTGAYQYAPVYANADTPPHVNTQATYINTYAH